MQCLDGISRSKAKAILSGGGVRVDNKNVSQHDFELRPGMVVEISKHKPRTQFQSKFIKIVYEDAQIIVIEKNIGILSMAATQGQFCVKTILDDYFRKTRQKCTAHVVHRLDRDTSGLLVYAKTIEAEQILEHNWSRIVTDRRYVALVSGEMRQKEGVVESWLKDNKAYITYSSPTDNGGKFARTHYRTLRRSPNYSLVELKLDTGRKIKSASTFKISVVPFVATSNTETATIPSAVCVYTPSASTSITPSRANRCTSKRRFPRLSQKCLLKARRSPKPPNKSPDF